MKKKLKKIDLLKVKKILMMCMMFLMSARNVYAAGTFDTSSISVVTDFINLICKLIFIIGVVLLIYGGVSYVTAYKQDNAEGKEKASKELIGAVGFMIIGGSATYFSGMIN